MAKLKSPLSSLSASGRLSRMFTFLRRSHSPIVEETPIPKDAKSFAQLSWRHMYQKACALWQALSDAEKQSWESLARPFHMTGFAYFISQALKPNPGLYLPLQGGKMAGDIDMDGFKIEDLPDPTSQQEAVTLQYFEDNLPAGGYTEGARVYHNANQNIASGVTTTLAFNSERYDTDTIHDNVVFNSRLTCKTAGKYTIAGHAQWQANVAGVRLLFIVYNGAVLLANLVINATTALQCILSIQTIYPLAVNDFVDFRVMQTSGIPLALMFAPEYSPEFMMQRVG